MSAFIHRLEEGFIALLLAAMTIVTFSQVVARYVFDSGATWALELTTYLFAWLVLFGMSYGVKTGLHLGVDAVARLFAPRIQKFLTLLVVLCCLIYAAVLFIGAWEYVGKIYEIGIRAEDLRIPRWIPYAMLPVGLALLFLRFAQAGYQILTGARASITASHEVEEMIDSHAPIDGNKG